jgi:hypothetical protein
LVDNTTTVEPRVNQPTPAYGVQDEQGLMAMFQRWDKALGSHWDGWRLEARVCYDFVAGYQWTAEEEAAMLEGPDGAQRTPVVFNRTAPTVDSVCGAEITGRQQVQYYPREIGDGGVSDVLTQGIDYFIDECDGNEENSEAFRDMVICGVGITEGRVNADDGNITLIKERIDPLEVLYDPSARKACFADARYLRRTKKMSLDEFNEEFPNEDAREGKDDILPRQPVIVDPRVRYTSGMQQTADSDEVVVCEWQWKERVKKYAITNPDDGETLLISADQHEELSAVWPDLQSQSVESWRFRRAFTNGEAILSVEDMPVEAFSYVARTGKRDRNKGWWYGIVRPMLDPQRFANKYFSQILHIINANAKGGIMAEEGAVEDMRNLEDTWADTQKITWVKDGALSNANGLRIVNKPSPPYPNGSERMMEFSIGAIRDVTGVNQEMLGLADRDQPGVLEHQRKQAAYGILAAFFDNAKRALKIEGRLFLMLVQKFIPADTLVRIIGKEGGKQYVPIALDPNQTKFDVSIDEAPAGPNQKERTFQVLTQIMPLLQNADLSPEIWADIARYSPLPTALSEKIAEGMMQKGKAEAAQGQMAAQIQQIMTKLGIEGAQAEVAETNAQAAHHQAQAAVLGADAQTNAVEVSSKDQLNRSAAALNMAKIVETMTHPKGTSDHD